MVNIVEVQIIIKLTVVDIIRYFEYCKGKVGILVVLVVAFVVIEKQVYLIFSLISLPFL